MKTFLEYYKESLLPDFSNLELYHGSNVEFDVFDFERFGQTDSGTMGPGFYLTGKPEEALRYAENAVRYRKEGEPHVLIFEVKAKKPLILDSNNVSVWEDKMRELNIEPDSIHNNARTLMDMGYDSVVCMDGTTVHEMVVYAPGLAVRKP